MKATGMVRRLDELGRIVIPKEIRMSMGIEDRAPMEIFTNDNQIVLRKYEPACIFSGKAEGLIHFQGKMIHPDIIREMYRLLQEKE